MKTCRTFLAASGLVATLVSPALGQAIALVPVTQAITDVVAITHAGDGTGRLFLTRQGGTVRIVDGGGLRATPFADITALISPGGEGGSLSVAFHPRYATNGRFFIFYTNAAGNLQIDGLRVSANPNVADPASRATILTIPHPTNGNHNGGQLAFGPDGFLYIGTGDGGSGDDPLDNGQNINVLLGKILRLDVDGTPPYSIPPGNPFAGAPNGRREIWAYGLRNPWRFSFDRATGDLFIGDVGQGQREEVDFQAAGAPGGRNYGWDDFEGTLRHEPDTPGTGCGVVTCVAPILEYNHGAGDCSITGGYRSRGAQLPALAGRYVYADFCTGIIRAGTETAPGTWSAATLLDTTLAITTFGEGESGALYVSGQGGGVFQIVGTGTTAASVNDPQVTEGDGSGVQLTFTVTLSAAVAQTVSVAYATAAGTAGAGIDYTTANGSLSFPPGATTRTVAVSVTGDVLDENDETLTLNLSSPVGATIADPQGTGTILDNDPLPLLRVADCSAAEGNAGTTPCVFTATLATPSGRTIAATYATVSGTATAGSDFTATSGTFTLAAGATAGNITVSVNGDAAVEPNETFTLNLGAATNVVLAVATATGVVIDDDATPLSNVELLHGTDVRGDLAGGTPRLFAMPQAPFASYEAVLEDLSGDALPGVSLTRVGADGTTVLQTATASIGGVLALRWSNTLLAPVGNESLRIAGASCGAGCGADDRYRLRAWATTLRAARFNNAGTQTSVAIVQNGGDRSITGVLAFWSAAGEALHRQPFNLAPRASLALAAGTVPALAGLSGSVTLVSDAAHGALRGKVVSLEPATGFAFDAMFEPTPR